jgi:mono/diheme cytochrome c family protein
VNGQEAEKFPFAMSVKDLERGRERFNIFCAPCHSQLGDGNGIVVQRGFKKPPSYYDPRLMKAPVGHFFNVMTNGWGAMADYSSQVPVADRWRIAAYIRALQLSQNSKAGDVPATFIPPGSLRAMPPGEPVAKHGPIAKPAEGAAKKMEAK